MRAPEASVPGKQRAKSILPASHPRYPRWNEEVASLPRQVKMQQYCNNAAKLQQGPGHRAQRFNTRQLVSLLPKGYQD